jgi:hypothetical protein
VKGLITVTALSCGLSAAPPAATIDTLKQVLERRLLSLRPQGKTERNVLFQDVRAGTPNGGYYPFQVTAIIRDYGPGYPANHFYGETCIGKMDKWTFQLSRDEFGEWKVEGRMTVSDSTCTKNPAAGVSSVPLAGRTGSPAPPQSAQPSAKTAPVAADSGKAGLPTGEWACYGTGGRVLFGFYLLADGTYLDGDRKKAGTYTHNGSTITFHSGPMDGQLGRNVAGRHFDLTRTVSCEASLTSPH